MTPEDEARARAFVNSIRWKHTFALAEHWYSVPAWAPDAEERAWFVRLIGRHGYRGAGFGGTWRYLELGDGYRYWCSKVWHPAEGDERPMINKARVPNDPQMRLEVEP